MLLSSLAFSLSNFFIFLLARTPPASVPSGQVTWIRFLFQAALSILSTLVFRHGRLRDRSVWLGKPGNELKLLLRGAFGVGGLGCWVWMLSNVSLSDAAGITFLNIPLTALFARIFLKEPYSPLDAATGLLGLCGVVLVAQPAALFGEATPGVASQPLSPVAVLVGLCGACLSSGAFLSIRNLGGEDVYVVTLWFSLLGCLLSPFLMLATSGGWQQIPSPMHSLLLCGVGASGFLGQLMMNFGMGIAPAGPASVMRYLDLINALWMQSLLLHDVPNVLKWVGSLLVFSSIFSVVWKARKKKRAEAAAAAAALAQPHDTKPI